MDGGENHHCSHLGMSWNKSCISVCQDKMLALAFYILAWNNTPVTPTLTQNSCDLKGQIYIQCSPIKAFTRWKHCWWASLDLEPLLGSINGRRILYIATTQVIRKNQSLMVTRTKSSPFFFLITSILLTSKQCLGVGRLLIKLCHKTLQSSGNNILWVLLESALPQLWHLGLWHLEAVVQVFEPQHVGMFWNHSHEAHLTPPLSASPELNQLPPLPTRKNDMVHVSAEHKAGHFSPQICPVKPTSVNSHSVQSYGYHFFHVGKQASGKKH